VKLVRWSCAFILMLSMSGIVLAKEKEKVIEGQNVDSGSFGVFMNGRRVGTETFRSLKMRCSVIHSEFKADGSSGKLCKTRICNLQALERSDVTNGKNRVQAKRSRW